MFELIIAPIVQAIKVWTKERVYRAAQEGAREGLAQFTAEFAAEFALLPKPVVTVGSDLIESPNGRNGDSHEEVEATPKARRRRS